MEDVEAAFYEAWEDAGLADEAPPRAKGSRPSSQKKRKVVFRLLFQLSSRPASSSSC